MENPSKRKVTVKSNYNQNAPSSSTPRPRSRTNHSHASRPTSPFKPPLSSQSSSSSLTVRPKAKINSSATPVSLRKASSGASGKVSSPLPRNNYGSKPTTSTIPRPISPVRPVNHALRRSPSPTFRSKASTVSTARGLTIQSTLGTPDIRPRPITAAASDLGPLNGARTRHGSVSLHHAVSFSSLHRAGTHSVSESPGTPSLNHPPPSDHDVPGSDIGTKIKAKVSSFAKTSNDPLSPSQVNYSAPPVTSRSPDPSMSSSPKSSSPSSPKHTFYPITTATAAANPYRFGTTRASPSASSRNHYQLFPPAQNGRPVNHSKHNSIENIDPAPRSPPASAVSFSSQSSTSRSSVSYSANSVVSGKSVLKHQNGLNSAGLDPPDDSFQYNGINTREENNSWDGTQDRESDGKVDSEMRKIQAEAKSIRKIADLEITNRSLLAINTALETTKHKQAKEIRELRRKLRESRLILPPRAYRAVKSSLDHDDTADEDDEDDEAESEPEETTGDEVYERIKIMLERLLESGKRALESKPEDFPEGFKGVAKVLNAEEVRSWRGLSESVSDHEIHSGADPGADDIGANRHILPSRIVEPDSDDDLKSEEAEAVVLPGP